MSLRRSAAALVLAGGALLASAPHAAAATPSGAWTDPAPAETVDGVPVAYLEQPGQLKGQASFEGTINGVSFTLVEDAAAPPDPCSGKPRVLDQQAPGGSSNVAFAFEAPFPCNRRYLVRATVQPAQRPLQQDRPLVLNLWVAVAIPPPATSGLTATVADRSVVLRWDPLLPTPDAEGFQVQRSVGGGDFTPIGEAAPVESSFTDGDVPAGGGTLRYRVVAMRGGPDAGTVVFGPDGDTASADVPPVAGAEPGDGSVGGGGDGGGSGVTPDGKAPRRRTTHRVFRAPRPSGARSTTVTTLDTGFQQTLPFQAQPAGDPAVVARIDGDDDTGQRQTLLLVAGGTTAFSWAMLLRLLLRRAAFPA